MSNEENITKIAGLICGLYEYYNAQPITQTVGDIYITALKPYPYEKIKAVVDKFILENKFMPKVSEFVEVLSGGVCGDDLVAANAENAWSLILSIIEKCGRYESFTILDKVARKALEMTGYDVICAAARNELHWKKRDFVETYKNFTVLRSCGRDFDAPDYFVGIIEQANAAYGDYEECPGVYAGKTVYIAETKEYKSLETIKIIINKKETYVGKSNIELKITNEGAA